jgi:hypothetical protein
MPGFAPYLVAGGLVLLAMDFAAPPAGVGMPTTAWPSIGDSAPQIVNRESKRNRLPLAVAKQPAAPTVQHVLVGCEPVFSPLSAAAQLNFPGRCIA